MVKALASGLSAASALVVAAGLLCSVTGALAGAAKSLEDLQATRQRPLFSPTRRPPPVEAVPEVPVAVPPPPPPPVPPPNLEVSGVIVGPETRSVIVHHAQDAKPTYLSVGSQIDGWTVSAIRSREVVLQHDTRSVTIGLPDPSHRVGPPGAGQAGLGGAASRMKPLRPEPEL